MINDTSTMQIVMVQFRRVFREFVFTLKDDPWQALLALLPLLLCIPWNPVYSTRNYEYQLHLAYVTGIQYGKEILATYGPLGFLTVPLFHSRTFPILIVFNLIVYLFLIARLSVVARGLGDFRYGARVCLVCLPTAFINTPEWSALLFVPYFLVLVYVLDVSVGGWKQKWLTAANYGIIFASFTLAKMTFAPLILPILLLTGIIQLRQGLFPRAIPIYTAALLVLWIALGQSLGNIPGFLANSSEIVSGYKGEMQVWEWPALHSMMFLVMGAVILWLVAAISAWRHATWVAILLGFSLLLVLYSVLLNGFVRGDSAHVLPCILTTFSLWGIVDLLISSTHPSRGSRLVVGSWLAFGSILLALSYEWQMVAPAFAHPNLKQLVERPKGFANLAKNGMRHLRAMVKEHENQLRHQAVPGLNGLTVDVPNGDPGIAFVSGAKLRLRPTITAYSGYTPALTRTNADYLESDRGPAGVLLAFPLAIDGKFPTSEDPLAWLSLLTHYQYSHSFGAYEFYKKRPDPLEPHLVPQLTRTVNFDEPINVPQNVHGAIWAEIEITPKLVGRLVASAFKPLPVHMISTLSNGTEIVNRINIGMARTGFLLSPFVGDPGTLRALFANERKVLERQLIEAIRIDGTFRTVDRSTSLRLNTFYEDKIQVRLFSLNLRGVEQHQNAVR